MPRKVVGIQRAAALLLAITWLCAGMAGLYLGFDRGPWLLTAVSIFAICYAGVWLRVVAKRRLLSWREVVFPWDDR